MKKIKVFAMNDCDWVAGEDLKSCVAWYLKTHINLTSGDYDPDYVSEARELSDADMETLKYHDTENDERITFAEQLRREIAAGHEFPLFFATTEY